MMYTAFRNGMQGTHFNTSGGFTPQGCAGRLTMITADAKPAATSVLILLINIQATSTFHIWELNLAGKRSATTAKLLGLGAYDSVSGEGQAAGA